MDTKKQTKSGINSYQKTDVLTANRETILLMLYSGAVRFLKLGIAGAEKNDRSMKCENITKAQRIVSELRATLNYEAGGEIAKGLESLYSFVTRRLVEGVMTEDTQGLQEALKILEDLASTWEQAINKLKSGE
ncbi:MAG: flagellar export chaperone FliS [Deltaproteobacteria bacterium]|nr:flagellar export chaperone FliS [Deltaproteobacteria bacterium]